MNCCSTRPTLCASPEPIATIAAPAAPSSLSSARASRRTCVTLRRYHALRQWSLFVGHRWRTSGSWLRSGMTACFWPKEVPDKTPP